MANEKRLIDANALLETGSGIKMIIPKNCHPYEAVRIQGAAFKEAVEKAPTVDAVEVVHGQWVKKWHDNNLIGHEYEECSVCGSCVISDTEKFWDCNYCPNCGAKMDLGV